MISMKKLRSKREMKTLSDSAPLVRLLSLWWQLPCNLLVDELPKMTHWILLAPSGQLVLRDFLGFEIFLRFLVMSDLSLWLSLLLFLIPSRFSPCHLFYYNSFPVLVKSHGLLIYITTNQRLSHGIVSACWRLPAKAFATKNNTTTLWYNQATTKNNTTTQLPRTIQPHIYHEQYCAANQPNNKTSTLSHKTSNQQSYPHYSHYQSELTL